MASILDKDTFFGEEIDVARTYVPIAWRRYVYQLRTATITETMADRIERLLEKCQENGTNPFTLKDAMGETIYQGKVDAVRFEILAREYCI